MDRRNQLCPHSVRPTGSTTTARIPVLGVHRLWRPAGSADGRLEGSPPEASCSATIPDPLKIELYNLQDDIGESRDVAADHPEIVAKMRKVMDQEHLPSKLFPLPPLDD